MYVISKAFHFSASHCLDHLPIGHQCARLHGHNYVVEVVLGADQLDGRGFVEDYGDLGDIKRFIDEVLDHRHLNEVVPEGMVTTAESLARWLFDVFSGDHALLLGVRVSETPKTWATYWRPGVLGVGGL